MGRRMPGTAAVFQELVVYQVRQCNGGLKHKEKAYFEALATGYARLVSGTQALDQVVLLHMPYLIGGTGFKCNSVLKARGCAQ